MYMNKCFNYKNPCLAIVISIIEELTPMSRFYQSESLETYLYLDQFQITHIQFYRHVHVVTIHIHLDETTPYDLLFLS